MKIIETLPNISEGRNSELIRQIRDLSDNYSRIWFISCKSDEYFNRSFISVAGDCEEIEDFLYKLTAICIEKIDMNNHTGYHPRIGAIDVIPIVPVVGITFEEANNLVERLAKKISESFSLPIYLYEKSAKKEERKNINNIRKGEFEFLEKKMKLPEWKPDFGPDIPHPTAGATIMGVRDPLITLDFHLNNSDRWLVEQIEQELLMTLPANIFLERKSNGKFNMSVNAKEGDVSLTILYNEVIRIINHFGCELERVTLSSPIMGSTFLKSFRNLAEKLDGEIITIEEKILANSEVRKIKKDQI